MMCDRRGLDAWWRDESLFDGMEYNDAYTAEPLCIHVSTFAKRQVTSAQHAQHAKHAQQLAYTTESFIGKLSGRQSAFVRIHTIEGSTPYQIFDAHSLSATGSLSK